MTLHTDPEAAKNGPFGRLIASGWHTAGLMTRLFMEHYLTKVASAVRIARRPDLVTGPPLPGRPGLSRTSMLPSS